MAAPIVHAHLTAEDASRGLCGEHHSDNAPPPSGEACSLCVAGAHAPAMREPGAPRFAIPAAPARLAGLQPEVALGIARGRPGTPRAPPLSA